MWVRKRIDVTPFELMGGMVQCLSFENREATIETIRQRWVENQTFTCLSVRSGFDLLLSTLNWPQGSEILMTGMTIPDMPKIVSEHGLKPVGLDLDLQKFSVTAQQIRDKTTPNTKAIVVAHLFGGLCDLEPILEVAREFKLLVIEDCAQAYSGRQYRGDERADISMFSFGAIKTNTALCGGVFVVRRAELLARLNKAHQRWPVQTRLTYFRRLFKYCGVKLISTARISGLVAGTLRLIGKNHDGLAVKLSRGFSGGDFFNKIRQQPSLPLLKLMLRKFTWYDEHRITQRTRRGRKLEQTIRPVTDILGGQMNRPTYWVFPILVENREEFVQRLWKHGFDATTSCSMQPVDQSGELKNVEFVLNHIVFLPFDLKIPDDELQRLAKLILEFEPARVRPQLMLDSMTDRNSSSESDSQHAPT